MTILQRLVSPIRKVGGFSASILVGTVIGVFAIPLLTAALGQERWSAIAVLQTAGQLGAVFVAFGWGATGPSIVASMPPEDRRPFYRHSFRVRTILYLAAVPVLAVLLTLPLHGDVTLAVLGALAYLLPGLGAGWYFTGVARPGQFFFYEALPTAAGAVLGIAAAMLTGEAWTVPAAQFVGSGVGVLLGRHVILRGSEDSTENLRFPGFWATLREQRHAVLTASTSALYVAAPLFFVSVFFVDARATYAMADRLFKYASLALLPIQQVFQGWVPAVPSSLLRRARLALLAGVSLGIVGGACVAVLSPVVSPWFNNPVPFSVSLPLGVAFAGVATSGIVGYACLVVVGKTRFLAVSTVVGALVGLPLMVSTAVLHTLPGVAAAVAVTELTVAAVQVVVLIRELRRRGSASTEA